MICVEFLIWFNDIWLGWIPRSRFFPVKIFPKPNGDSNSVKNSESHDIKFLTWFPGNPTLEFLIKICNCVGYTNKRGRYLLKMGLIALFNCPVIFRYFLVWVYLILSELTQFQPTLNPIFGQFFIVNYLRPFYPPVMSGIKNVEFYRASFDMSKSLSRPVHLLKRPRES